MTGLRAEVAGAGFAGLAVATALARAGWSVCVHEAAAAHRAVGSGIYVFPFAQEALARIGAFDRVRSAAWAPRSRTIIIDGEKRSTTVLDGVLTTTRAALHGALLETALQAGVEVRTGSAVTAAEPDGTVHLEQGPAARADLVVLADGVRSEAAAKSGFAVERVRHADGITRVLLDREGLRSADWDGVLDMYDYRYQPLRVLYTPCGADAFYICLMAPAGDGPGAALPVDATLWSRSFPLLADTFARIGDRGRHDRYGTIRLDCWSSGRIAVVGDAAHAMPSSLGQGAGVSMLNAVELGEAMACMGDVSSGLAAWGAKMRPIVASWQQKAEEIASQRSLSTTRHPGTDFAAELVTPLEAA